MHLFITVCCWSCLNKISYVAFGWFCSFFSIHFCVNMTSMLLPAPLYYLMSVFNCSVILHLFRKKGIHFVSIDETHPLSEQGPFDIILHKVRKLVFLLRWYCSFGYLLFLTPSILIWWAHFLLVQWPRQTSVLIIPFTPIIRFSLCKPAVEVAMLRCSRQATPIQRPCKQSM